MCIFFFKDLDPNWVGFVINAAVFFVFVMLFWFVGAFLFVCFVVNILGGARNFVY